MAILDGISNVVSENAGGDHFFPNQRIPVPLGSIFDHTDWRKIFFLNYFINKRIHNAIIPQTKRKITLSSFPSSSHRMSSRKIKT